MSKEVLKRLLVKGAVSYLAVFMLILTVTVPAIAAIAANSVNSTAIVDGQVKTEDVAKQAITTKKIANKAITSKKIANDAIGSAHIKDGSITSAEIGIVNESDIYYNPRTAAYSIAGSSLLPPPGADSSVAGPEMWLSSGTGLARAPVHLPANAFVTKVRARALDDSAAGAMFVTLRRYSNNIEDSGVAVATTGLTIDSGSYQTIQDIPAGGLPINNNIYSYMVWANFSEASSNMKLRDIVIEYQYFSSDN